MMIDNCEIQCRLCFVWQFTYFPRGYLKFFVVLVGLVIIFKDYIEDFVLSIMDKIDAKAKIF